MGHSHPTRHSKDSIVMADTCERFKDAPDIQEFYLGIEDQRGRGRRRKQRKTWRCC